MQAGLIIRYWIITKELGFSLCSNDTQSFRVPKAKSKLGDMTFKNFISRLLNKHNFSLFIHNFEEFKQARLDNKEIYNDLNILLKYFPKFNCDLNFSLFILKFYIFLFFFLCSYVYSLWIGLCPQHLSLNKLKKKINTYQVCRKK